MQTNPAPQQHVRDADFSGRQFAGLDLRGLRLHGCRLDRVDLSGANLADATLRGCVLDEARAEGCCLARARIEDGRAVGIHLARAQLAGASLHQTDFSRAVFDHADLRQVVADGASFRGASVCDAQLRNARLHDADFRGANLEGADFTGADLTGGDFRGALLEGARFRDARVADCRFDEGAGPEGGAPAPEEDMERGEEQHARLLLEKLFANLAGPAGARSGTDLQRALAAFNREDGTPEVAMDEFSRRLGAAGLLAASTLQPLVSALDTLDSASGEPGDLARWQALLEQLFPELTDGCSYEDLARILSRGDRHSTPGTAPGER